MVISIDSKAAKKRLDDADQIPIFELDGKTYSIPAIVRAEMSLNYAAVVLERGEAAADAWLLIQLFGQEAFDALRAVEGLGEDELNGIRDQALKVIAPAPNPKGRRG